MVLLQSLYPSQQQLYDVSDPLRPRLLCRISYTSAHLFTGDTFEYLKPVSATETDVMLHSLGSGHESVAGKFPFNVMYGSWLPNLTVMAYTAQVSSDSVQVWLYSQNETSLLFSYRVSVGGCICRFGLPPRVLTVSPDGQYLVAGVGWGSDPLAVYRVSDRTRVATLNVSSPFWDRLGHRLFLGGSIGTWTPEAGVVALVGAASWSYFPGESPDGSQVVYTAYSDPTAQAQPRIYVYDLKAATTRMLIDKLRTQVVYVKDGWVWYLEEAACDPAACNAPWGTQPTGKVFAMQLPSGAETEVTFGTEENPIAPSDGINPVLFGPGEFWPAT